jgi:hypothetical protein
MSLWNNRPNCGPTHNLSNWLITLSVEKWTKKFGATLEIFQKYAQCKQSPNSRKLVQSGNPFFNFWRIYFKSFNLVTLMQTSSADT